MHHFCVGVPLIAYNIAKKLGFRCIGIAPNKAKSLSCFNCDEKIFVGQNFGDESKKFLESIDILIKYGGGKQSQREYKEFKGPKFDLKIK